MAEPQHAYVTGGVSTHPAEGLAFPAQDVERLPATPRQTLFEGLPATQRQTLFEGARWTGLRLAVDLAALVLGNVAALVGATSPRWSEPRPRTPSPTGST